MSRFARRSVGFTLTMLALLPMASGCTPEGSGAYKGPYEREVNLAIPAIEKSAGFPFKRMPKVETRSKDDVRGFLERKFDESTPALELAGTERAYKILGLLPDSLDLRKFMLKLLAEQVLGYYDPATKVLYVVEGADKKDGGELVQVTIAHELVHALSQRDVGRVYRTLVWGCPSNPHGVIDAPIGRDHRDLFSALAGDVQLLGRGVPFGQRDQRVSIL